MEYPVSPGVTLVRCDEKTRITAGRFIVITPCPHDIKAYGMR